LFVAPPDYTVLKDVFDSEGTAIISGNRGTGKTIILLDIQANAYLKKIVSYIGNYESIPLDNNILNFYSLILQNIVAEVLMYLSNHKEVLKKLSKEDKIFLSFLIMKYADSFTNSDMNSKIENVQLSRFKRIVNRASLPITALLNYGTTTLVNFGSEFLNQFSGYLPSVDAGKIRKIFPDIHFEISDEF